MMKILVVTFLLAATHAQAFCGMDTLISVVPWTETQSCTTSGYCMGFGYNPETNAVENYYGFHPNCEGTQEKTTTTYTCQREDSSTYEESQQGFWGFCNI